MIRYNFLFLTFIFLLVISLKSQPCQPSIRTIYQDGNHNAFTSLVKFKGKYFCAFRSGESHVGGNGRIKILTSKDGITWTLHTEFRSDQYDLRDPKLSITPDHRMMLLAGGSEYKHKKLMSMLTHVTFSNKRGEFNSELRPVHLDSKIKSDFNWLWRVTWQGKTGYGVVYGGPEKSASLVKTSDGIFYKWVTTFALDGSPNEATIRFFKDGTMGLVIRREEEDKMGVWGTSISPYSTWSWKPLLYRLGGPDLLITEDDHLLVGTRKYEPNGTSTVLLQGNRSGVFQEICQLPSGGDNSYPSILLDGDRLLMAYYSSHEGKSSIYLAEIPMPFSRP